MDGLFSHSIWPQFGFSKIRNDYAKIPAHFYSQHQLLLAKSKDHMTREVYWKKICLNVLAEITGLT